jgi:hypothetical protein
MQTSGEGLNKNIRRLVLHANKVATHPTGSMKGLARTFCVQQQAGTPSSDYASKQKQIDKIGDKKLLQEYHAVYSPPHRVFPRW